MTGPLWESGHPDQKTSIVVPAATVAERAPFLAPKWQIMSGSARAAGETNPRSNAVSDHPNVSGGVGL